MPPEPIPSLGRLAAVRDTRPAGARLSRRAFLTGAGSLLAGTALAGSGGVAWAARATGRRPPLSPLVLSSDLYVVAGAAASRVRDRQGRSVRVRRAGAGGARATRQPGRPGVPDGAASRRPAEGPGRVRRRGRRRRARRMERARAHPGTASAVRDRRAAATPGADRRQCRAPSALADADRHSRREADLHATPALPTPRRVARRRDRSRHAARRDVRDARALPEPVLRPGARRAPRSPSLVHRPRRRSCTSRSTDRTAARTSRPPSRRGVCRASPGSTPSTRQGRSSGASTAPSAATRSARSSTHSSGRRRPAHASSTARRAGAV